MHSMIAAWRGGEPGRSSSQVSAACPGMPPPAARGSSSQCPASACRRTFERNTYMDSRFAMPAASPRGSHASRRSSWLRSRAKTLRTRPDGSSQALQCHCPSTSASTLLVNCAWAKARASWPEISRICAGASAWGTVFGAHRKGGCVHDATSPAGTQVRARLSESAPGIKILWLPADFVATFCSWRGLPGLMQCLARTAARSCKAQRSPCMAPAHPPPAIRFQIPSHEPSRSRSSSATCNTRRSG